MQPLRMKPDARGGRTSGQRCARLAATLLIAALTACGQEPPKPPIPPSPAEPPAFPVPPAPAPTPAAPPAEAPPLPPSGPREAKYDRPAAAAASFREPLGHCVVMVGFDAVDADRPELRIVDPADNLIGDVGRHLWREPPTALDAELRSDGLAVALDGQRAVIFGAIVVYPPEFRAPMPTPGRFEQAGMPDLSQHAGGPGWRNYCAPTAAANLLYHWSDRLPAFADRYPLGPGVEADHAATLLIGGLTAPPPRIGSLAERMRTSMDAGTSAEQLVTGLLSFLGDHGGAAGSPWRAELVAAEPAAAPRAFWERLCADVAGGAGVLLALHWEPLPGDERAEGDEGAGGGGVSEGDAAASEVAAPRASEPAATEGGGALPGPPSTHTASAALPERAAPVQGVFSPPPPPPSVLLPALTPPARPEPPAAPRGQLVGRWRQVSDDRQADFAEGGYRASELVFGVDGTLRVERVFDAAGSIRLVHEFAYVVGPPSVLTLSAGEAPFASLLLAKPVTLPGGSGEDVTLLPTRLPLPARLKLSLDGSRLELGGKRYARQ